MDPRSFDTLTRTLSTAHTRRRLTRLLGGLGLAGVLTNLGNYEAAAAFLKGGDRCKQGSQCKTGKCLRNGTCSCSRKFPSCKQPANLCEKSTCDFATKRCVIREITCDTGESCQGGQCEFAPWTNQTTFGASGFGKSEFNWPHGVFISPDDLTAFIADAENHRISVWTRSSGNSTDWANQTTFGGFGSRPSEFKFPFGVFASRDGLTAYIADTANHRVSVWRRSSDTSTDWAILTTLGIGTAGSDPRQFDMPGDIAVSDDGLTVFVADTNNSRISVWGRSSADAAWDFQTTFGTQGSEADQIGPPHGITVSGEGRTVFIADVANHRVSVWTGSSDRTDWTNQITFGTFGSDASQFYFPEDVAVSRDGRIVWVADRSNDRISVWRRSSDSSTDWTNKTTFGSRGSDASQFLRPGSIAVTNDDMTMLIAEDVNDRISVWTQS